MLCPPPRFFLGNRLGESTEKIEQGIKDVLQFDYGEKKKFSVNRMAGAKSFTLDITRNQLPQVYAAATTLQTTAWDTVALKS